MSQGQSHYFDIEHFVMDYEYAERNYTAVILHFYGDLNDN